MYIYAVCTNIRTYINLLEPTSNRAIQRTDNVAFQGNVKCLQCNANVAQHKRTHISSSMKKKTTECHMERR